MDPNEDNDEDDPRLLHDLEYYVRSRGIENSDLAGPDLNSIEAEARARELAEYQNAVHSSIFGGEEEKQADVDLFLKGLEGLKVSIRSSDGVVSGGTPLDRLAASCDTVYAQARSRHLFASSGSAEGGYELDLQQFRGDAIQSFVSVAVEGKAVEDILPDHIVECCQIAHYLQCPSVLNAIVEILKASVDSVNVVSICRLADQLEIPSLFECSVSHLVGKLDDMQEHEHWDDFPKSLKHKVITMRNAVQSSILGRGQKSKVFFTSSDEFLAIFSDNIREQKERLLEAKRRQEEVIEERKRAGGRHRDPMGGSVSYAAAKIAKQERRIQTLERFYEEQKVIFSGQEKSPFHVGL